MSIWATWLSFTLDKWSEIIWDDGRREGPGSDDRRPYRYLNNLDPADGIDSDDRVGHLFLCEAVPWCSRVPAMRLSVSEREDGMSDQPGSATVVLSQPQLVELHDTLERFLAKVEDGRWAAERKAEREDTDG